MPSPVRHLVVPCAIAALATAAATQAKPPAAPPPTSAKVAECTRGVTAAQRQATYRAGMDRLAGTARMSLRLTLEESIAGARYRPVAAPGLGVWRKSRPGVRAFAYRQRVKALVEGAAYRVRVQYRWHRSDGSLLRSAERRSRACRQSDPLPNLRVQRIGAGAADGDPGTTQYGISVSNRGAAPAPASKVLLWVDEAVAGRAVAPSLAPGQVAQVFVTGPNCRVSVSAQADTDDAVPESDETDNVRTGSACPSRE